MDPMKMAAQGAVKKNLGPDPSMQKRVDLLKRLVAMKRDMTRGPVAKGRPVPRGGKYPVRDGMIIDRPLGVGPGGSLPKMPGRTPRSVPTRLPRPLKFAGKPGYNFGPPEGM
jgi:hypothetical protein